LETYPFLLPQHNSILLKMNEFFKMEGVQRFILIKFWKVVQIVINSGLKRELKSRLGRSGQPFNQPLELSPGGAFPRVPLCGQGQGKQLILQGIRERQNELIELIRPGNICGGVDPDGQISPVFLGEE